MIPRGGKFKHRPCQLGIRRATAEQHHTVGDCTPLCPSVWVRQVNFNPSRNKPQDAYGQPKSIVMTMLSESGLPVSVSSFEARSAMKPSRIFL